MDAAAGLTTEVAAAGSPHKAAVSSATSAATASGPNIPSSNVTAGRSDGIVEILKQMFPDCDEEYIRNRLGASPSMDAVRILAEEMAANGYPKQSEHSNDVKKEDSFLPPDLADPERQKKFGKRFEKALSSIRSNVSSIAPSVGSGNRVRTPQVAQSTTECQFRQA